MGHLMLFQQIVWRITGVTPMHVGTHYAEKSRLR